MNKQVKEFFVRARIKALYRELLERAYLPDDDWYLVVEGIGDDIRIPLTDADKKFTHDVLNRWQVDNSKVKPYSTFKDNGPGQKPTHISSKSLNPSRVMALRYALLHGLPFHKFKIVHDEHRGVTQIMEERKRVKSQRLHEPIHVATVDNFMRGLYTSNTGKQPKNDMEVAEWWKENCENAILEYPDKYFKEKNKSDNPTPQIKVEALGEDFVEIATRLNGKKFGWKSLGKIPIDMAALRKHAEKHGYSDDLHGKAMVHYDQTTWQKKISRGKPKPGQYEDNGPYHTAPEPEWDDGETITPGRQHRGEHMSKEFNDSYSNDEKFREAIDNFCHIAIARAKGLLGASELHKNSEAYEEIFHRTREHILLGAGKIKGKTFTDEWTKKVQSLAASGALSGIKNVLRDKKRARGDSVQDDSGGRAGGRELLAVAGGEGGGAGGAAADVNLRQGAGGGGPVGGFQQVKAGDAEDHFETPEDLFDHIRQFSHSMRDDDNIRAHIARFAKAGNPHCLGIVNGLAKQGDHEFAALAHQLKSPAPHPDDDNRGAEYEPRVAARHESLLPFTFRQYVERRTGR